MHTGRLLRTELLAVMGVLIAAGLLGCGSDLTAQQATAMEGEYLLYGFDRLALPGETISLEARLQRGRFLNDVERAEIVFSVDSRQIGRGLTDDEGIARIAFTPEGPGNVRIRLSVQAGQVDRPPPAPTELLVACRPAEEPLLIVDIDKTLVASNFEQVLNGSAQAMPHSAAVLGRLADGHTIVYMTFRPDHLNRNTTNWLAEQGYPSGPLLMARFSDLFGGNREYRTQRVAAIAERYENISLGIGDKISDAWAYVDNGIAAAVIVDLHGFDKAEDVRERAEELAELPDDVDVVSNWQQVEEVLRGGAQFPAAAMIRRLNALAAEMESR